MSIYIYISFYFIEYVFTLRAPSNVNPSYATDEDQGLQISNPTQLIRYVCQELGHTTVVARMNPDSWTWNP